MFPRARKDHLTIRELPEETLVYDQQRHKAHCLNATATLIWRCCDGNTSLDDLTGIVARKLGVAQAAAVVSLALEQLARRNLLEEAPRPLPDRVSRREALKTIARTAVLLPLIMSIATRTAAQSASGGSSDPPGGSSPTVAVQPTVNVNVNVALPSGKQAPATPPCRTRGQSCVASASGQQGTCCAGLACNGVAQNAGVCG